MEERDWYPDGEQAPGVEGEPKDWIPPKNFNVAEARLYTEDELRAQRGEVDASAASPTPPASPPPAPQPQPFSIGEFPTLGAALKGKEE